LPTRESVILQFTKDGDGGIRTHGPLTRPAILKTAVIDLLYHVPVALDITMTPHTKQRYPTHQIGNGNGKSIIVKLSRDQILASLEAGAKARCGMSARVMLRRYHKGRLADPSRITDLIALSNLLRKNDPFLAE